MTRPHFVAATVVVFLVSSVFSNFSVRQTNAEIESSSSGSSTSASASKPVRKWHRFAKIPGLSGERRAKLFGRLVGAIAATHLDVASASAVTIFAILAATEADVANALYAAATVDQLQHDLTTVLNATLNGNYIRAAASLARLLGLIDDDASSLGAAQAATKRQRDSEAAAMETDSAEATATDATSQAIAVSSGASGAQKGRKRKLLFQVLCNPVNCVGSVVKQTACRIAGDVVAGKSLTEIASDVKTSLFGEKYRPMVEIAEALVSGDKSKAATILRDSVKRKVKLAPISAMANSVIQQGAEAGNPRVQASGYLLRAFVGTSDGAGDWEALARAADLMMGSNMVGPAMKFLKKYVLNNPALKDTIQGFFNSIRAKPDTGKCAAVTTPMPKLDANMLFGGAAAGENSGFSELSFEPAKKRRTGR